MEQNIGNDEINERSGWRTLVLYLLRWQLSTPVLAVVTWLTAERYGSVISAVVANLIGGLLFYKIDKLIFRK